MHLVRCPRCGAEFAISEQRATRMTRIACEGDDSEGPCGHIFAVAKALITPPTTGAL